MARVTEVIYSGESVIVPFADVQHIERHDKNSIPGIMVITNHTRWDWDHDGWANPIWISEPEAAGFRSAWCRYRSELEADDFFDDCVSVEVHHNPDLTAEYDRAVAVIKAIKEGM